ncbi:NLR family CARD domain-containing protein 3 [Hondaea fermentalgiana]|uniref:NLR family CARD domain-containing protein 3 n=1 Tax=Hondaea fermentalgiana TaxID=2315210 RepID=A0A2R5GUU6_9STRA|nr:NLR family CARD domain-containing protein 3 [Hondaea fermentalgiana]|eukprot:GBG32161.1 NLR family CARD domain-containing protein 3 [Hondaea fermentalgiana]
MLGRKKDQRLQLYLQPQARERHEKPGARPNGTTKTSAAIPNKGRRLPTILRQRPSVVAPRVNLLNAGSLRRKFKDDDDDFDVRLLDLVKDKLKMQAFRKRMHWKWRAWCDEQGFPQEFSMEEYAERREKDPEKFAEEFPSILWQEERRRRLETEEATRKKEAEKKARREAADEAIRQEKMRVQEAKMRVYLIEHDKQAALQDAASIEAVQRVKEKVIRLEHFEDERHALETKTRLEQQEAERLAADGKAAQERASEEARLANEARDARLANEALTETVESIMICSGTKHRPVRSKPPSRRPDAISVRFAGELDTLDSVLLEFNLFPMADFMRRFPRARDAAKQFPHLFLSTTHHVDGVRLGVEGARAMSICLKAGAFPRMAHLRLGWSAMEFSGCQAISRALATGVCAYLTHLSLRGNGLGCGSLAALAEALRTRPDTTPKLVSVDFAFNRVECKGAKALAHLLLDAAAVRTLEIVNLDSNNIGAQGGTAIVRAAATRSSLRKISITSNRIDARTMQSLRQRAPATVAL